MKVNKKGQKQLKLTARKQMVQMKLPFALPSLIIMWKAQIYEEPESNVE